jgi:hypothetical protein
MWLSAFRGDKSVKDGMLYTHYFAVRAGRYRGFEFFYPHVRPESFFAPSRACRLTKRSPRREGIPCLTHEQIGDRIAPQFWPNDGMPVLWPPSLYFGYETIYRFIYRWENLLESRLVPCPPA